MGSKAAVLDLIRLSMAEDESVMLCDELIALTSKADIVELLQDWGVPQLATDVCNVLMIDDDESETKAQVVDSDQEIGENECALCERLMPLTRHHLVPRTTHSRMRKRGFTAEQLNQTIDICRPCHSGIHRIIDHQTMAEEFASLEALIRHPGRLWVCLNHMADVFRSEVLRMAEYISKQRPNRRLEDGHWGRYQR